VLGLVMSEDGKQRPFENGIIYQSTRRMIPKDLNLH